jgi:hypothetical protein
VPLDLVEFGPELGQGGHADHDHPARSGQITQAGDGGPVVVKVLDHVERQHGVERLDPARQWLGQVELDEFAAGFVQILERPKRDVGPDRLVSLRLQPFEHRPPAATGVEDPAAGVDPEPPEQVQHQASPRLPPGVPADQAAEVDQNLLGHVVVGNAGRPSLDHGSSVPRRDSSRCGPR